jgi:hypothetical protein
VEIESKFYLPDTKDEEEQHQHQQQNNIFVPFTVHI